MKKITLTLFLTLSLLGISAIIAQEAPIKPNKKGEVVLSNPEVTVTFPVPTGAQDFSGRADAMYGAFVSFKIPLTGKSAADKLKEIERIKKFYKGKRVTKAVVPRNENGELQPKKAKPQSFTLPAFDAPTASVATTGGKKRKRKKTPPGAPKEFEETETPVVTTSTLQFRALTKKKATNGDYYIGAMVTIDVLGALTDNKPVIADTADALTVVVSDQVPEQ